MLSIILLFLSWACDDAKSGSKIPAGYTFEEEIRGLKMIINGRLKLLSHTKLDSLKIESDTLYIFVADSSVNYLNRILVRHNIGVLFQDFTGIVSAPFKGISIKCRYPQIKDTEYIKLFYGDLESIKAMLHLFTNLSFSKVVNEVSLLNKRYPDKYVIERLNKVLHFILLDYQDGKYRKEETEYLDTVTKYLLECEQRKPGDAKKIMEKAVEVFREALDESMIGDELLRIFEENCKEIQELNPGKRKPIYLT